MGNEDKFLETIIEHLDSFWIERLDANKDVCLTLPEKGVIHPHILKYLKYQELSELSTAHGVGTERQMKT